MCGIIGINSNKPVSGTIINSLKKLEYRGYDSAGIATLSSGQINEVKSEGRVDNLENNSLVIMDEPFSALDIVTKLEIQDLFAEMLRDKTVLFVTHAPLEALRLGNYIYLMRGSPAYLEKISELSGAVPRDIKNNELHSFHGELLLAMRED